MKKTILTISISFLLIMPLFVLANGEDYKPLVPCVMGECDLCDFFVLINNIIKFVMIDLVPPLAVFMLLVGGVMYFMGGMSPNMIAKGKETFKAVAIGLLIVYTAWIVVDTILARSGVVEKTGTAWWRIECETSGSSGTAGAPGTPEEEYESDTFAHSDPNETEQQTILRTKYCEGEDEIAIGGECIAIDSDKTDVVGEGQITEDETGYTCVFKGKSKPDSDLYYTPEGKINVTCIPSESEGGEEEEEEEEESRCEDCGGTWNDLNVCDKEECLSLGDCVYDPTPLYFGLAGKCYPSSEINNQSEEE